jgi:hypothetical protein
VLTGADLSRVYEPQCCIVTVTVETALAELAYPTLTTLNPFPFLRA